jgi:hypothetical protein
MQVLAEVVHKLLTISHASLTSAHMVPAMRSYYVRNVEKKDIHQALMQVIRLHVTLYAFTHWLRTHCAWLMALTAALLCARQALKCESRCASMRCASASAASDARAQAHATRAINVVSAQSCLIPALVLFRFVSSDIRFRQLLRVRFFRFVSSRLLVSMCFYRFVSSDSFLQMCFFRLISSDLFLQICFVQSPLLLARLVCPYISFCARCVPWGGSSTRGCALCIFGLFCVNCASLDCASLALQVVLNWRAGHASQLKLSSYVRLKVFQHLFLVCLLFCCVLFFILLFESFVFVSWFQHLQICQIHLFVHISHDSQIS